MTFEWSKTKKRDVVTVQRMGMEDEKKGIWDSHETIKCAKIKRSSIFRGDNYVLSLFNTVNKKKDFMINHQENM